MRIAYKVLGILGGFFVAGIVFGMAFSTDDTRGFEEAIAEQGYGYESVLAAIRDKSSSPCVTDGLGVKPVPFGVVISWCDASWFLGMERFLVQLSGPRVSVEDLERYLAIPNGMDANALLREMYRRFSEGQVAKSRDEALDPPGGVSFGVMRDFGEQTVYPEQILADMMLGDIRYVIAGQKNMNIPLVDLPAGTDIEFAGIFAQRDNGPWTVLLDITHSYGVSPESSYLAPNVHEIFFEDGKLYVDILDAGGAGSGEGRLARLRYEEDEIEQWVTWEVVGEMYYVPELYTRAWSWEHINDEGNAEKAWGTD